MLLRAPTSREEVLFHIHVFPFCDALSSIGSTWNDRLLTCCAVGFGSKCSSQTAFHGGTVLCYLREVVVLVHSSPILVPGGVSSQKGEPGVSRVSHYSVAKCTVAGTYTQPPHCS